MAEVILGVVRSLERTNLKSRRTHVVLLSPAAHILHDVSKSRPDLYIHQVNPAAVPFRRFSEVGEPECHNDCCKNVFISNWGHFQSLPGRMKRIVKYARSLKPVGEITKVCIDVRAKDGCKITECVGLKDIANLRLGQVHTIFAKLQITRSAMRAVDLLSKNPVFNSSLDHKELRQQLQNAAIVGAVKAHLLDVQVYHQNSLHATDCWNYTETPFLVIRDLGGLAPPFDTTMEALKRRLFHKFVQLDAFSASIDAEAMLSSLTEAQGLLTKFVNRILKEVDHHQQVFEYEQDHRQKLPLCPGPITIEATPHEWLSDLWNRNKTKRRGVAVAENEELSGLIDRLHGPERLG